MTSTPSPALPLDGDAAAPIPAIALDYAPPRATNDLARRLCKAAVFDLMAALLILPLCFTQAFGPIALLTVGALAVAWAGLGIAAYAKIVRDAPDYRPTERSALPKIVALALCSAGASVAVVEANSFRGSGYSAAGKCQSNLRQIGQAIYMYATGNRGAYPPSLDVLLIEQDLTPDLFVCCTGKDVPATGPTTRAIGQALVGKPGHCSYVYLGRGLSSATPANVVVAYEPPGAHGTPGIAALFADGHVEVLNSADARALLAQIKAGVIPPVIPPAPAGSGTAGGNGP